MENKTEDSYTTLDFNIYIFLVFHGPRLPNLANKNAGYPVKFEFQINDG